MGSLLNGRYELGDLLGSGGMGRVHRATDLRLARDVAIKILRAGTDPDQNARARFRAEAQLAGSLHHPGIAQVYDVGEDESSPERDPFIVMQLVEGTPLSQVMSARGTVPPDEVALIVAQVADALSAAHAAGIVHRDLKPSNIMITPTGQAVLVDFGIAWSADNEPLTATGSIIGTADYFSPEQASGRPATPRSDLYSLGIVAHHCLTGQSPFRRDTPVATAMAHLSQDLPPLGDDVPPHLSSLITALTQKDPDDRPSSASAVASLARAEHPATAVIVPPTSQMLVTAPVEASPAATAVQALISQAPISQTPPAPPVLPPVVADEPSRPFGRYAAIVAVAVVVLLAVVVGLQSLGGGDPASDPTVDATTGSAPTDDTPTSAAPSDDTPTTEAPETVTVDSDSLIGSTFADASATLTQDGLRVVRDDVESSETPGTVIAVDPSGDVEVGSTITLTVAVQPVATDQPPGPPGATDGGPGGKKEDDDEDEDQGRKGP